MMFVFSQAFVFTPRGRQIFVKSQRMQMMFVSVQMFVFAPGRDGGCR